MKLSDFFVELGINAKETGLQNVNDKIGSFLKKAGLLQISAVGLGGALSKMTQGVAMQSAELEKFTKNTGLAVEELQRWQEAGQKIDITLNPETITKGIANLQKNLDEIKFGRGDIGAFQILGIEIQGKDAFQVLEDLRSAVAGMSSTEVRNLINRTGLDENFVSLLKVSKDEFSKLAQQVRLTSEQRGGLIDFGKNTKMLKLNLNALQNQIGANLAPTLSKFFISLNRFLQENMQPIIAGFKIFTDVVFKFSEVLYNGFSISFNAISGITSLFQDLLGKQAGLIAFSLIIAKMFLPLQAILRPINLAIGGIALLLDDIQTWKMGDDSFLGDFYNWVVKIYDKLVALKNTIFGSDKNTEINQNTESNQAKTSSDILKEAGKQALKFGAVGAVAGNVIPGVGTFAGGVGGAVYGFIDALRSNAPEIQSLQSISPLTSSASPTPQVVNITINRNDNSQMNFTSNEDAESIANKIADAEANNDAEMLQAIKTYSMSTIH
jgi:hypothetical protein